MRKNNIINLKIDKIKAERKIEEDIIAYRDLSMKKLEDKKKLLDNEKLEKLNMLKIKLSTIKGVDEEDLRNTETALSQMEEKMKNYQKAIATKVSFLSGTHFSIISPIIE